MSRVFPAFIVRRVALFACAAVISLLVLNSLFSGYLQLSHQLSRSQLHIASERDQLQIQHHIPSGHDKVHLPTDRDKLRLPSDHDEVNLLSEQDKMLGELMDYAPPGVMDQARTAHRNLVKDFTQSRPRGQWHVLADPASVLLQLHTPLQDVSEHFLSVTLDSCAVQYNWSFINFAARRVVNMARALAPAMLRIGGTHQGFLVFEPDGEFSLELHRGQPTEVNCYPAREDRVKFPMTMAHFDAVNLFARKVGWELVFGLNSLLRDDDGAWASSNAEKLLHYAASKGYKVNWQLGNGNY